MTEPATVPADVSGPFEEVLAQRSTPTIAVWNRLEGRPRTIGFDRALRAEVRDALWMLTRQWQMGEYLGTDGGSPVTATYAVDAARPSRFRPDGGPPIPLPTTQPLESVAERRALPFAVGADPISFDLRLAIGHRWLKLVRPFILGELLNRFRQQYVRLYPIDLPDPEKESDAARVAHPEVWATMQALAGRHVDGYRLYQHLKHTPGAKASDGVTDLLLQLHFPRINKLGVELVRWFDALIDQPAGVTPQDPTGTDAWDGRRLEHRFSVAALQPGGTESVLTAREYPGGRLDWHAFSVDQGTTVGGTTTAPESFYRTVFPAPVRYSGMPLPRWWAVEDGGTNFAAVTPDSTDLARLIFLEFALVYSNDWYQLPCELPVGSLADITGLVVTDTFGQKLWITPANAGADEDWRRWSMFGLDTLGTEPVAAATTLLVPAAVPKIAEGPALEEVALIRDENANLVWAVEGTVRMATGDSRRGSEVSAERIAHRRRFHPLEEPGEPRAAVAYELMNTIPEHWIPFIPVHRDGSNRAIQLQRAALPSVLDGKPVQPRTQLLREGLDAGQPYFVDEQEVPRAGTRLHVAFNRTRWRDGRVVVWLSAQRGVGRGEGSSGLRFDTLVETAR
jgi:hypothetical protein